MRRLPPLRAFQSFEVAAHHESFSRAAAALCVTHSAISHQIRSLETWLGKDLFVRHNSGVPLTPDGEQLKHTCIAALSLLEGECGRIRTSLPNRKLTIACAASFLAYGLFPIIGRFARVFPEIVLNFQTTDDFDALLSHKVDALILCDHAPNSSEIAGRRLAVDDIGPVCAPDWPMAPRALRDIDTLRLLHAKSRIDAWTEWAKMNDVQADHRKGQTLDSLSLTLEAARSGLGIAIAPKFLVRGDLDEGRLIAPLGFTQVSRSTFLFVSEKRKSEPAIAAFCHWLVAEIESQA